MAARNPKVVYMDVEEQESSSDSSAEDMLQAAAPQRRRRIIGVAVSTTVLFLGAVAIYAGSKVSTGSLRHVDKDVPTPKGSALFETESAVHDEPEQVSEPKRDASMTIAEFVTTHRLGEVAADALDTKCPIFEPKCDVKKNFVALMHKQLKNLEKHDADLAKKLHKTQMTPEQQETIVRLLPLARNPKVMEIGSTIATTVKRWAKKGQKTVHHKVKEVLVKYSKDHGVEAVPPVNASKPENEKPSFWSVLMHPKMLAMIGDDKNDKHEQPLAARRLDPIVVMQSIWGIDVLLRLVLLIFQVLDKYKKVIMPMWLKTVIMWGNVIGGGITCVITLMLACPIVFLQYWLNAWLLFSNNLGELEKNHIPFWKILLKLPGLDPNTTTPAPARMLLADPRFAA